MPERELPEDVRREIASLIDHWREQQERHGILMAEAKGELGIGYAARVETYRQCELDLMTAFNLVPHDWHD